MDKNTQKQLIDALKTVDVKELYASEEEQKRKWFRFGAYDALRMACEVIAQWPTIEKEKNERSRSTKT